MAGTTPSTIVKGVPPDIAEATFVNELRVHNSPAVADAARVYAYCVRRGLSPAFLAGMFREESSYATNPAAICVAPPLPTRSWGNTTVPSYGDAGLGLPFVRGRFTRYAGWYEGGISTVARLFEHPPYQGKATIAEIIRIWAPPDDNNRTEDYIAGVVATMNRLGATPQTGTGGSTVAVSKPPMQINPSPNRGGYAHPHKPLALCWHITAGTSSLGWLTNPASGASSNYLIDRDGTIHELVPPTESAWANGKSCKPDMGNPIVKACIDGGRNLNTATISIEHEGKSSLGQGGSLTTAQIAATVKLSAWLCATFGIAPDRGHIIKHAQIDACDRPNCPGFSEAEWSAWVGKVAALVGGTTPVEGGDVREPAPEKTIAYLNAQGNLIVAVNLGGTATKVLGANVADLGGSVENAKGEQFDRSVQANVFKEWAKRP